MKGFREVMPLALIVTIPLLLWLVTQRGGEPEVFAPMTFDAALEMATEDDRLLLVDLMATWCPPCRRMDRSTWRNDGIEAWIETNAIAVQVDVDQAPAVATRLGVQALPTIVLMRGDRELGRIEGYQDGRSLLDWLETRARPGR